MAPTKRPKTPAPTTKDGPPMVLTQEVLDDLRWIEPLRSRKRVISALNEAFLRIISLERMHAEAAPTPTPPKRAGKKPL